MTDKTIAATSYAGGLASVLSALTLTDVGIIVGVLTALLTFAMNAFYQARKDKREQHAHELYVRNLMSDRSPSPVPAPPAHQVVMDVCPDDCPYAEK